jgi:RNA polymerase sigma factor (TIGR02999 family)
MSGSGNHLQQPAAEAGAAEAGATEAGATATVTRLMNQAGAGDARAAAALLPLVYEQLRRLAERKMRHERPDQTLQATALVHEAYLRLVDETRVCHWDGRWHFFAAAAEAMRRILIDRARQRSRLKRGGGRKRVALDELELTVDQRPEELLALDEALEKLAGTHPQKAQLVKLRYFGGLTIEQAAAALGISTATADRHWAYSKAWLYRHVNAR